MKEEEMTATKEKNTMRLLLQNVNSLSIKNEIPSLKLKQTCQEIKRNNIDIALMTESNANAYKRCVHQAVRQAMRETWASTSIVVASVPDKFETEYQPGGLCTIATSGIVGFLKEKGTEKNGRWSWFECYRNSQPSVLVINAYMPCQHTKPGMLTYQMQLYRQGISNTVQFVRQQCWNDLTKFVMEKQREGHDIIIGMDANSDTNKDNSLVTKFRVTCNLVDVISMWMHNSEEIATHVRGKSRIDTIMISPELVRVVKGTYILPFDHITTTDHNGVVVDFDMKTLFGRDKGDITKPATRQLRLSYPDKVKKYVEKLQDLFDEHNIQIKTKILYLAFQKDGNNNETRQKYENISELIKRCQKAAEKKCSLMVQRQQWSPQLHQEVIEYKVLLIKYK